MVLVDTLATIVKAVVIGFIAASPTGPSGVLVIRRTLDKGRWGGFFTGLGVALSDALYIFITIMCLSLVLGYLEDPNVAMVVKIVGCCLLLVFGISTCRNNPLANARSERTAVKDNALHCMLSGFLVAVVNPLVVFIYMGLFAFFSVPVDVMPAGTKAWVLIATMAGDICWWLLLSYLINKLRNRFDLRGIWMINRILGAILITVAIGWFILLMIE